MNITDAAATRLSLDSARWLMVVLVLTMVLLVPSITQLRALSGATHDSQSSVRSHAQHIASLAVDGKYTLARLALGETVWLDGAVVWDEAAKQIFPSTEEVSQIFDVTTERYLPSLRALALQAEPQAWTEPDETGKGLFCLRQGPLACLIIDAEKYGEMEWGRGSTSQFYPRTLMAAAFGALLLILWSRRKRKNASYPQAELGESVFLLGDMEVDGATLRIRRGDHRAEITARDLKLLRYFQQHPDQVISKDRLYDAGWGRQFVPNSRSLEQHISNLRKKMDPQRNRAVLIATVHGQGYRYPCSENAPVKSGSNVVR